MKKILFGAMMLLAAVGFTSCDDKNKNNKTEEEVTSLNLNKTEYTLAPQEKLQLKGTTNTGISKTLVWETSNAEVATVSDKGEVTAMAYGEANITCSLKENSSIKAVCKITVESALKTLKFTRASVSQPAIDSTKIYTLTGNSDGNPVELQAYMGKITVWLYSEGFYINNDGKMVSEDPNKAFCIYIPTTTYVITANLNPKYFNDETGYATWIAGGDLFKTSTEDAPRMVKEGAMDEEVYMTHMKAAFGYWNKYANDYNDEESYKNYWIERYAAVREGISGSQLYKYEYDEESGEYDMHATPSAIVTELAVRFDYAQDDLKYMYNIASYDITVKPLGGLFGCDVKQNSVTYEYSFISDNVIFEDPIQYTMLKTAE